jgi:UDPglucose 6-dehydrogenase
MLRPDLILIGESDERSGELLASIYSGVCDNAPAVARMGFANAELTKLAVNTFVTTKISYANMLAELCEEIPGGDIDVVTRALGLDSRIGGKYLRGAVAYGGPCFPRDNLALATFARGVGREATLAEATEAVNRRQVARLVEVVQRVGHADAVVGVLGLAYKPKTNVVDESVGVALANELAAAGRRVVVHDPLALENAARVLDETVERATSVDDALTRIDIAVVTTPWLDYRQLATISPPKGLLTIVDCWRLLDGIPPTEGIAVVRLGLGTSTSALPYPTAAGT